MGLTPHILLLFFLCTIGLPHSIYSAILMTSIQAIVSMLCIPREFNPCKNIDRASSLKFSPVNIQNRKWSQSWVAPFHGFFFTYMYKCLDYLSHISLGKQSRIWWFKIILIRFQELCRFVALLITTINRMRTFWQQLCRINVHLILTFLGDGCCSS